MPNKEFKFRSSKHLHYFNPTNPFSPSRTQPAMANKLKLPFLFKPTDHHPKPSWLWRSCTQTRTHSFRTPGCGDDIFKTINSAYSAIDATEEEEEGDTPGTGTSDDDQIEAVVRGLRPGERLFLELEETNSIMEAAKEEEEANPGNNQLPFKESVVLAMDSKQPYLDFKKSMEEMVEAHGLKERKGMEELLSWYLKANGKGNHEYIIGAFVDLLVGLAFGSSSSCSSSSSSSSCCCCSCNSPSSLLCSSSFASSSASSSFGTATPCIISSSSVEIHEDIDCTAPCLSSLFEDDEEEGS